MNTAERSRPAPYPVRVAQPDDLPGIVGFEVTIARMSFGTEAVVDPAVHARRVTSALGKPGETMLVVGEPGAELLGWAWVSARRNSLTGAQYGNFRSLAVADYPHRAVIGEALLAAVLDCCQAQGIGEVVGRVHAANLAMRTLYRAFDFEAAHLTMRRRLEPSGEPQ